MYSHESGGNYSAILKDLMARRAALDSAMTKLQAPQAGRQISPARMEGGIGKQPDSDDAKKLTAN